MSLLLSQCLVAYTFLQGTLSLLWWTLFSLSSSQISSVLTKLFICFFSISLAETIMGFVFLVKNSCRALCCHRAVAAPFFFFSFFFFFFFFKKNFTEALIAKKKFSPETIQNIDASSMFDRMLWLKLQQWWFGAVSL